MKTQQIYASHNCTLVRQPPYPSPGLTLSSYYCSSPLSPSSLVSSNNFKINYNQHVELYCDTTIMHHLVLPPYRVPSYTIIVTSWFVLDLFHIASLLASLCGVSLFVIHMQQSHDSITIFFFAICFMRGTIINSSLLFLKKQGTPIGLSRDFSNHIYIVIISNNCRLPLATR
jgi:hypothetical protein